MVVLCAFALHLLNITRYSNFWITGNKCCLFIWLLSLTLASIQSKLSHMWIQVRTKTIMEVWKNFRMDVWVLSSHSADDRNQTQNGSKLYLRSDTYIRSRKKIENYVFWHWLLSPFQYTMLPTFKTWNLHQWTL